MRPDIQTFPATTRLGKRFFVLGIEFSSWGWGFGPVPGVDPSSRGGRSIKIHGYVPPFGLLTLRGQRSCCLRNIGVHTNGALG